MLRKNWRLGEVIRLDVMGVVVRLHHTGAHSIGIEADREACKVMCEPEEAVLPIDFRGPIPPP